METTGSRREVVITVKPDRRRKAVVDLRFGSRAEVRQHVAALMTDIDVLPEDPWDMGDTIPLISMPASWLRQAAPADDDGWTGPITAWQARRNQPSCPSTWTPDGGPTFACTLVPGHEAVHESWKHGATFPQAAWTDADADQRGEHPYPPVGDAEAAAVVAVDDDMGDAPRFTRGDDRCGASTPGPVGPWTCTAQAGHGVAHMALTPAGREHHRWPLDADAAVEADRAAYFAASEADRAELIADASLCLRPGEHPSVPEGKRVFCDRAAHHATANDDAAGPRHDPAAERAAGDDTAADALVRADERSAR